MATEEKNKLPKPLASKRPEKKEDPPTEIPEIQTKPTNTGLVKITEDPTRGQLRIFRFKLLVAQCEKNTSFKKGVITISKSEHVHWFRTHDARTGMRHDRATLACGHSHPIEIAYLKDEKTGKVTGIDMDKCKVGPSIKEVVIGMVNAKNKRREWMAVKLGEQVVRDKETYQEKTEVRFDNHRHALDYIDYEDVVISASRAHA